MRQPGHRTGGRIAFLSDRDGHAALYLMNTDGSGVFRVTTVVGSGPGARLTWSPDSTLIGFDCEVDAGNEDICVIGASGAGFRRLTLGPGRDINPAWSPDGQQIAFATDRYAPGATVQLALMRPDGSAVSLTRWRNRRLEPRVVDRWKANRLRGGELLLLRGGSLCHERGWFRGVVRRGGGYIPGLAAGIDFIDRRFHDRLHRLRLQR